MDKFDQQIKDALNNYEAPYDASHWTSLNKKMNTPKSILYKWIGGAATIAIIALTGYYLMDINSVKPKNISSHQKQNVIDDTKTIVDNNSSVEEKNVTEPINDSQLNQINTQSPNQTSNNNVIDDDVKPQNNQFNINDKGNHNDSDDNIITPHSNTNSDTPSNQSISPKLAKAVVVVDNNTKCLNEAFEFRPSVPKQNAIYQWNLGDGTIVNANYINHTYNKPGTYKITLTLKDLKSNEIIKISEPVEVNALEIPQSSFSYEFSNGVMPTVKFKNNTDDVSSKWEILGVGTFNTQDFEYTFKHKGEYVVKLTTTNENGCKTTSSQVVKIEKDYSLLAPNAFSPNGDNLNDYFIPKALPLLNLPFTMLVYDRQGNLIFETNDSNKPWNGINFKTGVPATDGVYVWIVQLTNENGEIETYQDQITITR
jgi:gliding motility-associated-like protein